MKSKFSKKIKFISLICIISFMFQGCAGKRAPILVDKIQKGDSELSCKVIQLKLNSTKDDIKSKQREIEKKEDSNMMILVLSLFIFLMMFAYDLSEDEEQELKSLEDRLDNLEIMYIEKCGND